jgi:hypothetical protein
MSRQDDIKKLIITYNRRLQIRQEQKALEGPFVSPNILLEIEDIEAELKKLQQELADLEIQAASPRSIETSSQILTDGQRRLKQPKNRKLWAMIVAGVAIFIGLFAIFLWLINNADTNHPPSVQSLIASPTTLTVGQQAKLTVIATDVDRDSLAYYWEAQKGSVPGGAQSETITYTAPPNSGLDTVKVIITDGNATVTQEIRLSILAEQ